MYTFVKSLYTNFQGNHGDLVSALGLILYVVRDLCEVSALGLMRLKIPIACEEVK